MKRNLYLSSYLAQFSLEQEIIRRKAVEKNKNTNFMLNNILPEIVPFLRYCRARQATDEIRGMRIACWIRGYKCSKNM